MFNLKLWYWKIYVQCAGTNTSLWKWNFKWSQIVTEKGSPRIYKNWMVMIYDRRNKKEEIVVTIHTKVVSFFNE